MIDRIKKAKADTLMRVNNVIYAKVSDAESSAWRSAFGVTYANAFINMVLQDKNAEFLTNESFQPVRKVGRPRKIVENDGKSVEKIENSLDEHRFLVEGCNVREEERNEYPD